MELKACPFCGGKAIHTDKLSDHVVCTQCKETHIRIYRGDFSVWNERVDLAAQLRAKAVQGVKACPLCGSYGVLLDFQSREIFCPKCGLHHGLGILHSGPLQEIIDAWNRRANNER